MNRWVTSLGALLAASVMATWAPSVEASSHAEAPGTASDLEVDNTDVWAWRKGNNLIILAGYNGLSPAYAAPNWKKFASDALYQIHIARGPSSLEDRITYSIKFTTAPYPTVAPGADTVGGGKEFFAQLSGGGAFKQTYTVFKIVRDAAGAITSRTRLVNNAPVAPPNVGPNTNSVAYAMPGGKTYEQYFVDDAATSVVRSLGTGEGRVFAGPRDDPFFVDLGGVFDLARLRSVVGGTPRDSVQYYNVNMIALEIPIDVANGGALVADGTPSDAQTIGVWASASRPKVRVLRKDGTSDNFGGHVQVSRLGLPLINEAVIGLQDKDRFNRKQPKDDLSLFAAYFLNPVIVRDAEALMYYAAGGPLAPCVTGAHDSVAKNHHGPDLMGRMDIVSVINLGIPALGSHTLTSIGDVLRVDLGAPALPFTNGRPLLENTCAGPGDCTPSEPDVTDIELSLLLCPELVLNCYSTGCPVPDGVARSEVANRTTFPYAATPWEAFSSGVHAGPSL